LRTARFSPRRPSKGNRVKIPEPGTWQLAATRANPVTSAGAPGRDVFSFSQLDGPEIGLHGDRACAAGKAPHVSRCPDRPQRPLKSRRSEYCSRTVVLITASGLQGEQPLVNGLMWVREVGKTDP
ncbi:hypothetical protein CLOP_g8396, partial [Closterium sp. NIES-67]